MKTIFMALMVTATTMMYQTEVLEATFLGYEDETYYFEDATEKQHTFSDIEPDALKSFDLRKKEFEGKKFKITYSIETEIDEYDEESDILKIASLELMK